MPPVGLTLTDDQIAGVLTYIRREWGQDGTAGRRRDGQAGARNDGGSHAPVEERRIDGDGGRWSRR